MQPVKSSTDIILKSGASGSCLLLDKRSKKFGSESPHLSRMAIEQDPNLQGGYELQGLCS